MTINTTIRGMELTEAISAYVTDKMSTLEKYEDQLQHLDVEIGKNTQHHQKGDVFFCKVAAQVPGDIVRIEKDEEDLYKAIDKVRDHLRMELTERKQRIRERAHGHVKAAEEQG